MLHDRDVQTDCTRALVIKPMSDDWKQVPVYVRKWCKENCEEYGRCGWLKENCPHYDTPQWREREKKLP